MARLKSWSKRHQVECYRVYDRDIPEYPLMIDRYGEHSLVVYTRYSEEPTPEKLAELQTALALHFGIFPEQVMVKSRAIITRREAQYERQGHGGPTTKVTEGDMVFWVNLADYLDTGIFLDHRPMRQRLRKTDAKQVLNLFSYTCTIGACAARAGARTTNIDLSNTYLTWGKKNYLANGLATGDHDFLRGDVLSTMVDLPKENFDLIFCDPPTFSNSAKTHDFDVQAHHEMLVDACMDHLRGDGLLLFSTNKRKFRLAQALQQRFHTVDVSSDSIPPDFRDKKIHQVFEIRHRNQRKS